jgi:hypothetical protein
MEVIDFAKMRTSIQREIEAIQEEPRAYLMPDSLLMTLQTRLRTLQCIEELATALRGARNFMKEGAEKDARAAVERMLAQKYTLLLKKWKLDN